MTTTFEMGAVDFFQKLTPLDKKRHTTSMLVLMTVLVTKHVSSNVAARGNTIPDEALDIVESVSFDKALID